MFEFREIVLLEALKILKKASENPDKRQAILKDIHKEEIKHYEDDRVIGDIDGLKVVKSIHVTQNREGDQNARDYNVKDSTIIKALKKAKKKGFRKGTGNTLITYRNKSKKYDLIVANWSSNAIIIITMIQDNKNNPKEYFSPKHQKAGDTMITTESLEKLDIENVILLGDIN